MFTGAERSKKNAEKEPAMTPTDKAEIIRKCYLFTDASPDSIARLSERSLVETTKKNRALFAAEDEVDGLRILIGGLVRIWINDPEGRELTLTLIEPGEAFGEIALLDGDLRSANATVIEASQMLLLKRSAFDEILDSDPKLARHLIVLLCDRLRRNTQDLRGFAFQGLRARLGQKLYELSMAHAEMTEKGAKMTRKFSQTEFAQMLGATREAINKLLAAMSFDGLVTIRNGWIEIPDLEALRREAAEER